MKFNVSFINEIKIIILKSKLNKFYIKQYPNSKYSLDYIISSIFYILKTGISFRNSLFDIKWQTIYWHYKRFIKYNIFKKLFVRLRKKYTLNNKLHILLVDTSFIPNKYGINFIARNKFYKNKNGNKISVITDKYGIPLSILVNKSTIHDIHFVNKHTIELKKFKYIQLYQPFLLADKAYYSKKLANMLSNNNIKLCVPKKKNTKQGFNYSKSIYKNRIFVEHCFQKLKTFKRLLFRYDKLLSVFKQNIFLSMAYIIFSKI